MQEKTLSKPKTRTSNIHSSEFGAISYDIFGSPYQKSGSFLANDSLDFGYLGKPYNADTELYDYGFRDYSPEIARFFTVDPIRDGRNWYSYVVNDPVNFVDLWGLQCKSESDGESEGKIGEIKGYPETGNTEWRSYNDQIFIDACNSYNEKYNLTEEDDGYITPKQLKAWAMVESGGAGDKEAFLTDPLQVNNPGDWDERKKDICGLEKKQEMTPAISAAAALEWFRYKGFIHDSSGKETIWRGNLEVFQRYNRNTNPPPKNAKTTKTTHRDYYADKVIELGK
ncbi:MAG: RHS repeat-associated core domain-containing protein [Treponemataceae bacterium]|nr:RHS repeat-associated core domain-containing protein [Treponemataceae bacterium]